MMAKHERVLKDQGRLLRLAEHGLKELPLERDFFEKMQTVYELEKRSFEEAKQLTDAIEKLMKKAANAKDN